MERDLMTGTVNMNQNFRSQDKKNVFSLPGGQVPYGPPDFTYQLSNFSADAYVASEPQYYDFYFDIDMGFVDTKTLKDLVLGETLVLGEGFPTGVASENSTSSSMCAMPIEERNLTARNGTSHAVQRLHSGGVSGMNANGTATANSATDSEDTSSLHLHETSSNTLFQPNQEPYLSVGAFNRVKNPLFKSGYDSLFFREPNPIRETNENFTSNDHHHCHAHRHLSKLIFHAISRQTARRVRTVYYTTVAGNRMGSKMQPRVLEQNEDFVEFGFDEDTDSDVGIVDYRRVLTMHQQTSNGTSTNTSMGGGMMNTSASNDTTNMSSHSSASGSSLVLQDDEDFDVNSTNGSNATEEDIEYHTLTHYIHEAQNASVQFRIGLFRDQDVCCTTPLSAEGFGLLSEPSPERGSAESLVKTGELFWSNDAFAYSQRRLAGKRIRIYKLKMAFTTSTTTTTVPEVASDSDRKNASNATAASNETSSDVAGGGQQYQDANSSSINGTTTTGNASGMLRERRLFGFEDEEDDFAAASGISSTEGATSSSADGASRPPRYDRYLQMSSGSSASGGSSSLISSLAPTAIRSWRQDFLFPSYPGSRQNLQAISIHKDTYAFLHYFKKHLEQYTPLTAAELESRRQAVIADTESRYDHGIRNVLNNGQILEAGLPFRLQCGNFPKGHLKLQRYSCALAKVNVSDWIATDGGVEVTRNTMTSANGSTSTTMASSATTKMWRDPPDLKQVQLKQPNSLTSVESFYYHNVTEPVTEMTAASNGDMPRFVVSQGGFYHLCWTVDPTDPLSYVDYGEIFVYGPSVCLEEMRWQRRETGMGRAYPDVRVAKASVTRLGAGGFVAARSTSSATTSTSTVGGNATASGTAAVTATGAATSQIKPAAATTSTRTTTATSLVGPKELFQVCQWGEVCQFRVSGDFYKTTDSIIIRDNEILPGETAVNETVGGAQIGRNYFYFSHISDPQDLNAFRAREKDLNEVEAAELYQVSGGENSIGRRLCREKTGKAHATDLQEYYFDERDMHYRMNGKNEQEGGYEESSSAQDLHLHTASSLYQPPPQRNLTQTKYSSKKISLLVSFLPVPTLTGNYALCWNGDVFIKRVEIVGPKVSDNVFQCTTGQPCFLNKLRESGVEEGDRIRTIPSTEKCGVVYPTVFQTSYFDEGTKALSNTLYPVGAAAAGGGTSASTTGNMASSKSSSRTIGVNNNFLVDLPDTEYSLHLFKEGPKATRRVRLYPLTWEKQHPSFRFGGLADFGLVSDRNTPGEIRYASFQRPYLPRLESQVSGNICTGAGTAAGSMPSDSKLNSTNFQRPPCSTLTTIVTPAVVCVPDLPEISDPILGRLAIKDQKLGTLYGSLSGYGPLPNTTYSTKKYEVDKVLYYEIDFGKPIELQGIVVQKPGTHMKKTSIYGHLKTFTLELDNIPLLDPVPQTGESAMVSSKLEATLKAGQIPEGGTFRVCTCSLRAQSRRKEKSVRNFKRWPMIATQDRYIDFRYQYSLTKYPIQSYYRPKTDSEEDFLQTATADGKIVYFSTDRLDPKTDLPAAILPENQQVPRKSPSFFDEKNYLKPGSEQQLAGFSNIDGGGYSAALHRQPTQYARRDYWNANPDRVYSSDYLPNFIFPETTFYSSEQREKAIDDALYNSGQIQPVPEWDKIVYSPGLSSVITTTGGGQKYYSTQSALEQAYQKYAGDRSAQLAVVTPSFDNLNTWAGSRTVEYPDGSAYVVEPASVITNPRPLGYNEALHGDGGTSASEFVAPKGFYRRQLEEIHAEAGTGFSFSRTTSRGVFRGTTSAGQQFVEQPRRRKLSYHGAETGSSSSSSYASSSSSQPTPAPASYGSSMTTSTSSQQTSTAAPVTTSRAAATTTTTMTTTVRAAAGTTMMELGETTASAATGAPSATTTASRATTTIVPGSLPLTVSEFNPVYPEETYSSLSSDIYGPPEPLQEPAFSICESHLDFSADAGVINVAGVFDTQRVQICNLGETENKQVLPGLDLSMLRVSEQGENNNDYSVSAPRKYNAFLQGISEEEIANEYPQVVINTTAYTQKRLKPCTIDLEGYDLSPNNNDYVFISKDPCAAISPKSVVDFSQVVVTSGGSIAAGDVSYSNETGAMFVTVGSRNEQGDNSGSSATTTTLKVGAQFTPHPWRNPALQASDAPYYVCWKRFSSEILNLLPGKKPTLNALYEAQKAYDYTYFNPEVPQDSSLLNDTIGGATTSTGADNSTTATSVTVDSKPSAASLSALQTTYSNWLNNERTEYKNCEPQDLINDQVFGNYSCNVTFSQGTYMPAGQLYVTGPRIPQKNEKYCIVGSVCKISVDGFLKTNEENGGETTKAPHGLVYTGASSASEHTTKTPQPDVFHTLLSIANNETAETASRPHLGPNMYFGLMPEVGRVLTTDPFDTSILFSVPPLEYHEQEEPISYSAAYTGPYVLPVARQDYPNIGDGSDPLDATAVVSRSYATAGAASGAASTAAVAVESSGVPMALDATTSSGSSTSSSSSTMYSSSSGSSSSAYSSVASSSSGTGGTSGSSSSSSSMSSYSTASSTSSSSSYSSSGSSYGYRRRRLMAATRTSSGQLTIPSDNIDDNGFYAFTTHPSMLAFDAVREYEAFKIQEVFYPNGSYPFYRNETVFSHLYSEHVTVQEKTFFGNLSFPYGVNSSVQGWNETKEDMLFKRIAEKVQRADRRESLGQTYVWAKLPYLGSTVEKPYALYVEAYASYVEANFTTLLVEKNLTEEEGESEDLGNGTNGTNLTSTSTSGVVQSDSASSQTGSATSDQSSSTSSSNSTLAEFQPLAAEYPTAVHFWKLSDVILYGPFGDHEFMCELGLVCNFEVRGNWNHLVQPTPIVPPISKDPGYLKIAGTVEVRAYRSLPTSTLAATSMTFVAAPLLMQAGRDHLVEWCGKDFCISIGKLYAKGIELPQQTVQANSSEPLRITHVQEFNTTPGSRLYVLEKSSNEILEASLRMQSERFNARYQYFKTVENASDATWEVERQANYSMAPATFTFPTKSTLPGGKYSLAWCAVGCVFGSAKARSQIEAYTAATPEYERIYGDPANSYQPLVVGDLELEAATKWTLEATLKCVMNFPCNIRNLDFANQMGVTGQATILLSCESNATRIDSMPVVRYDSEILDFGLLTNRTKPDYYHLCWGTGATADFLVTVAPIELVDPRSPQGLPV
ncbi:unnamed protein product [Amoebophrya sp. A120]|nr:unnamed protein product [Amoebophrya sp. A120]|eukprot:GSA120T00017303001.1